MTERNTVKIKRAEDIKPSRKPAIEAELRSENARLRAELAVSQQRVAELEQRVGDALNRIDWALDSLHNVTDDE